MRLFYKINCLKVSVLAIGSMLFFTGCDPVTWVVGGTAVAGTTTVGNQNGVPGSLSDVSIQTRINRELLRHNLFDRAELAVKHGNVVLIGYPKNETQHQKMLEIARFVAGSDHVYDESAIQEAPKPKDVAVDSSITSRVKSAMTFNGNVQSLNYEVTTVKGIVYICGTAQSAFEREIVLNCARETSGVKKVVAYVFINRNKKK